MNRSKLTYSEKQHLFINVSIGLLLVSNIYFILSCHLCIVKTLQFETIVLWYKLPLYLKSKSLLNAKLPLKAILHLISIRICILVGVNIETFIKNTTLHMV